MTQLYALIKATSHHYNQRWYEVDEKGRPKHFKVEIPEQNLYFGSGDVKGGPGGNYKIDELNFFVLVYGKFMRIK